MRLDKYLADRGVGSREFCKNQIRTGKISVDGIVQKKPEFALKGTENVCLNGQLIQNETMEYLLFHKPAGYLTAKSDANDRCITELLPNIRKDTSPVGRLDKDAEGLLILTNDGALAHRLLAPKNEVEKVYYFETYGKIPEDSTERLAKPIAFKEFTAKPAKLRILNETTGEITVTEGKYHEVKRLVHTLGVDVIYLKRLSFGGICLGDLPKGEVRKLSDDEISLLKQF